MPQKRYPIRAKRGVGSGGEGTDRGGKHKCTTYYSTIWLSFARLMTIWIFDSTGMLAGMRAREVELELQLLESTLEPKTK